MHDSTSTHVNKSITAEQEVLQERMRKLQAEYRSAGIMTPAEWPMNTERGRQLYRESVSRDRFLSNLNRRAS